MTLDNAIQSREESLRKKEIALAELNTITMDSTTAQGKIYELCYTMSKEIDRDYMDLLNKYEQLEEQNND